MVRDLAAAIQDRWGWHASGLVEWPGDAGMPGGVATASGAVTWRRGNARTWRQIACQGLAGQACRGRRREGQQGPEKYKRNITKKRTK